MIILGLYIVVNLIAFGILGSNALAYDSWVLIYPAIKDVLDENHINLCGQIIIYTLYTAAFLPAILLYFTILLLSGLVCIIGGLFLMIFEKKGRRY